MEADSGYNTRNHMRMVTIRLDELDWHLLGKEAIRRAMERIAEQLAEAYIAEHGSEILAAISPEAVATNTMAAAGAALNETLHKKWPDKILTVETPGERVVYQRGILGGLKRL